MDKWQPEQNTAATRDPGQNTCAGHSCTPFHSLSLLSHSCCICHLSELMLRFVLTPGKQKDVALYRQWQHTSLVTCTLTGLIFLFSLSPFPAVYPNQDPELSYQKRALEKLAGLNVKTFGKKKDTHLDFSCNSMSRLILLHFILSDARNPSGIKREEVHLGFCLKIQKGKHKILISIY